MASVEKRTDGRAGYVVRWRDETGRQRKKSFPKKALADRYRAEVEHSLNLGTYIDPKAGRTTFREYAERWRLAQPHRPNTVARVASGLNRHAYPVLGDRPVAAIRNSELQAWVSGLPGAPSSVRTLWLSVRAVLGAAVRDRLIGHDPCIGVRLPELHRTEVVPPTVAEVRAMAAAMPERYRALVWLCAGAGLRQGEAFGIQVADVDWLRRTVRVDRQIQPARTGGGTVVCPPKNWASCRTIPVGATVTDALAAHLAAYPAGDDGFIFTAEAGTPIEKRDFLRRVWTPTRAAAGLPDLGMHDLRHFYASVLIAAGRSVKTVATRLGHTTPVVTLNTYAHLWPTDDELDRRAVDDVFKIPADVPRLRPVSGS